MDDIDRLWMDSYGFVYSTDGKRLLKGANVEGAYWIPEGVEEIEPGALIGCKIGTLHVPWTAHVHEYDQLVFSEDEEEWSWRWQDCYTFVRISAESFVLSAFLSIFASESNNGCKRRI